MLFNLTNSQIRWLMIISLVAGYFVGIPLNLMMAKIVGTWFLYVSGILSAPFAIANLYWLVFPEAYQKFNLRVMNLAMKAAERAFE